MRVVSKCHLKALSENLELGLIGGVLASGIDSVWVICDIAHNGMAIHYAFILTTLLLSTLILSIATVRHHRANVKQQLGIICVFKKNVCKAKYRKARHTEKRCVV